MVILFDLNIFENLYDKLTEIFLWFNRVYTKRHWCQCRVRILGSWRWRQQNQNQSQAWLFYYERSYSPSVSVPASFPTPQKATPTPTLKSSCTILGYADLLSASIGHPTQVMFYYVSLTRVCCGVCLDIKEVTWKISLGRGRSFTIFGLC